MTIITAMLLAVLHGRAGGDTEIMRVVVAPAETMAVTHRGEGTPVVIIPGMLGGPFSFRKVTQALSEQHDRAIIIDPLGTGGSSRPKHADYSMQAQAIRVAAVLDSIGVERAVVVAHSAGVPIALRLGLLRPRLVSGVVAVNGSASEKFSSGGVKMAVRLAPILKLFGGRKKAENRVVNGMREYSADTTWITSDVVAAYTAPYRTDLGGALRVLGAVSDAKEPWPLLARLDELRMPVVLLLGTGASKPAVKPDEVAAFRTGLPSLQVQEVASAGAYVQEEAPELVVKAIRSLQ